MTLSTAFAFVVLIVSIIWAWVGVELLNFDRHRLCLVDVMFFLNTVIAFNLVAWA